MKSLTLAAAVVVVVLLVAAAGPAVAARVHVIISPATIAPGGAIRLYATASPCLSGGSVWAISVAFPGRAFGGEGALTGRASSRGAFTVVGRVRTGLRAGRYTIGFRCGGGNLGVTVIARVR